MQVAVADMPKNAIGQTIRIKQRRDILYKTGDSVGRNRDIFNQRNRASGWVMSIKSWNYCLTGLPERSGQSRVVGVISRPGQIKTFGKNIKIVPYFLYILIKLYQQKGGGIFGNFKFFTTNQIQGRTIDNLQSGRFQLKYIAHCSSGQNQRLEIDSYSQSVGGDWKKS